ncbi:TetR family transcriptional regulator [Krasilnikovia sp. M28-CT-15]|uniref:TetR family transcriptional regulator n=1 Tax=Krasilnikovia sp. M28-CT-15 TaxID=3373540 RepID=UPI003876A0AD
MTQAIGLRERKKAATRLALHEAALRLAAEHGFDQLTVEAIADAANVSRRTFFNYFSGKDEAIAYGDAVRVACLVRLVRAQPADEVPWVALTKVADQMVTECYADLDPAWLAQRRRLRAHPALAAQQIAAYATVERELAAELATRLIGPDAELRSRVLAATYLTTLRVAIQYWTDHPDSSIRDMLRTALAAAAPAR